MTQKTFLAAAGAVLIFFVLAFQNAAPQQGEKFAYAHVSAFLFMGKYRVSVDYGNGENYIQLKGEDGKQLQFVTPVDALNYMGKDGWELVQDHSFDKPLAGQHGFLMKKRQ